MGLLFLTSANNTITRKCKAYCTAFHEPFSVDDQVQLQESLSSGLADWRTDERC